MALSESELLRFQRQLSIEGWDQEKFKRASVLIVGIGGLGGIAATYLAVAGVGRLRLFDADRIELSNLNRQILFTSNDVGHLKVDIAAERLSSLNPDVTIETVAERMTESNATRVASNCDVAVDGLDNHDDRLLLNRVAFELAIPYVYGAVNEWQGQMAFFNPPKTPCLACLPSRASRAESQPRVFGALPGVIGSLQAVMVIRYMLTGVTPLASRLLIFQADSLSFESLAFDRDPDCPVCSRRDKSPV